jgi:16S rRNA (guanine1516-N2)-methyltransferase
LLSNGVVEAPIVIVADDATRERCVALAAQLNLPLLTDVNAVPPNCLAWLGYAAAHLQLHPIDARQSGPIDIDFVAGATARRALGGAELIVKAVRGRSKQPLLVLDATAGLGRDSFVLASRGFNILAIERNPVIAALLADGLLRAAASAAAIAEIASRINLHCAETVDYLNALEVERRPDVIYLDPMFPPSQKSALVKKEMRLFQQLLHPTVSIDPAIEEQQAAELLRVARAVARVRVVVKRPAKARALAAAEPDYALSGKAIRFDVYTAK